MCSYVLNRTTRTNIDTKRQNLLTLLTLEFRKVYNSLSFWHSLSLMGYAMQFPSHPMGHFPWDSHGNLFTMDKPDTPCTTPKLVTSCLGHLRVIAPGQHSSF